MGKVFMISLAIFASTGSFLFGYDAGVMTDVIASKNFLAFFHTTSDSDIIGAINSTFNGGAVFGALQGGLTMDRFGRKLTILMGALICLVGAILQCTAQNLAMILVGRIFTGWAVGLLSMAVPVYNSECADPKIRGFIVGLSQQMIGIGFIVSTWVGYGSGTASADSSIQWRLPLAFQVLPCSILALGIMFFPESPRHLMETDREDEALKVLRKLHYNGSNEEYIQREYHEIKTTIAAEKAITVPGWSVMFTVPQWRTRLMHGVAVQVFTQFTGINVIGYYQTSMYKALGIVGNRNLLVAGIYNCMGPLANLIFIIFLIDRVGRRKPLLWGTIGITIALICEAIVNSQINTEAPQNGLSIAGVFFLFCVTVIFSLSWGPISWVYMAEVMPMQIRARGNAFATGIGNWLVSTFWAQVSPTALKALTWKFYFLFVAWNIAVTFPIVFFFFKETKQISLEDIDLLFGERALGTLPDDLHKAPITEPLNEMEPSPVATDTEAKPKVEGEAV
ncbi:general substrate transporter [Hyaloscypha bicolor E]|uniref:General substrate transporter n=1 Tax=Hyaloscypha bicolor E TaxID=1095630 RepID=A0A2J6SQM1_9HELO|nr:general substrate transporter [Hyaloscypha bicolor E]PMD53062.1 general substrate transporter [Hyaloscypha bicolor E]